MEFLMKWLFLFIILFVQICNGLAQAYTSFLTPKTSVCSFPFPFDIPIYETCHSKHLFGEQLANYVPTKLRHIVVVIPSYNNAQYYERNLASVFAQDYENYSVCYVDDASSDGTGDLCKAYITKMGQWHRTVLLQNKENKGALANFYHIINLCDPEAVIVNLDGDDSLAKKNVLSLINKVYDKFNVLVTYGSYQDMPYLGKPAIFCRAVSRDIIEKRSYRNERIFSLSHLRTYKASLFQAIQKKDLIYEGKFFNAAVDLAIMYPVAEMAGSRIMHIPDILCQYNRETPLNKHKVAPGLQSVYAQIIKKRDVYPVIIE
jgi:glycosyltransferase involved in cell wall biosynthesis